MKNPRTATILAVAVAFATIWVGYSDRREKALRRMLGEPKNYRGWVER